MKYICIPYRRVVLTVLFLSGICTTANSSDCVSVYSNATRNITSAQRQQTELSYFFNRHCQKNGEINNDSLNVGVDAVVKQIPFGFSAASTSSKMKMEEFCKEGVKQNYFSSNAADYRNEVVVASLQSFNQCLALENKGLRVTHSEQPPQSVLIFGEFTDRLKVVSLDAVAYDPQAISCESTNFNKNGSSILLDGKKSLNIANNFTITCTRKSRIDNGKTVYPRTVVGISTSIGPYTVELIEDQLYGFSLASQAKANYDNAIAQRDAALGDAAAAKANAAQLQSRLDNVSIELNTVSYGEYDAPSTKYFQPRLYCGTDIGAHVKAQCGDRQVVSKPLGSHEGNKCGYGHFIYACIKK